MRGGKKGLTRHRDQMQEEYAAIRDGLLWAGTRWSPTSAKSWLKGTGNRLVLLKLRATEERPDRSGAGRVYPKGTGIGSAKEAVCGRGGQGGDRQLDLSAKTYRGHPAFPETPCP